MTEADISRIQDELDLELPDIYRDFLLRYPESLLDASDHGPPIQLFNLPDQIIRLNRDVPRLYEDWRVEHLVIGESGCGDYYTIDVDIEDSPVYFWNHEIGGYEDAEETASLIEFAGRILQLHESLKGWKPDV